LKLGREASCWCAEKSDAKLRILEVYLQLGPVRCCFCSHSCPVALLLLSSIQSLWHRVGRNDYRLRLFTGCHFSSVTLKAPSSDVPFYFLIRCWRTAV
jgi:hypothetical protein